ncbi:unnamed protein product [Cuscuta campestris]|uniref:Uncharacterized protein n=1 Tax=Cuscuta campestris TaxID=132261 RepID=A0A484NAS6_9ASTE|nr:unnamed protein product [Cuscuta campestris]
MKKVNEKLVPKTEDEFGAEDIKKVENYAKAINMLYCAVNPDDYRKISCCTTAKEMWDKLEVTYKGTDQVREAKIDFLTQEYEMFRMKEGKKIDDMFDRFSKIINDLHALKKTYANKDLVRKILRSLTPEWRSKSDAIYESIGVSNVSIDGLRGHIKPRCPKGKSGKDKPGFKKQRAYISWGGDSGDESMDQEEEEAANLCLMAHEDHVDEVQEGRSKCRILEIMGNQRWVGYTTAGREVFTFSRTPLPIDGCLLPLMGKSKSKASKKKGNAEATTSAPQPFPYLDGSFLVFVSEEELTRFLNHFAKRPISPPRVLPELYPQQKGYQDLVNQLQASGLWSFVSMSRQSYNPTFVRAFYSNLRRDGDTIRSSINLYDIEIDLPTFARVAGLPIRGDNIATYGGDDWILNNEAVVIRELGITNLIRHSGAPAIYSAPLDKRLLLYIITRILRPRDSSHTSLFNEDLKAIHAIIHGASINWAKFVMIHMADCASLATEQSLPYAFLIMDIIVSADIHIAGPDTKMTKLWMIADSTLRKKSGNRDGAGPSRAPAPAPAKASLQSIADTLNQLTLTVDGMGTILGEKFEGEDEDDDSYASSPSPDEVDFEDAVDGDPMDVENDEDDDEAEDEDADA